MLPHLTLCHFVYVILSLFAVDNRDMVNTVLENLYLNGAFAYFNKK